MSRRLACSRIREPISGWRLISTHSCGVERPGLVQDRVRDPELADVVEDAGGADALHPRELELQLAGDLLGVAPDRLGVARRRHVAQVERLGQQHRGGELLGARALGVAQRVEHLERLGVVDDAAVAPEALGGVERAVGGAHELGRVARLGAAAGDPDGHGHRAREGRELAAHEQPQVLRHGERARLAGAREHERELLAAEPRRHVAVAAGGAQHVGEAPQHVVARVVAERVVDALEVVEVEHEQRQLAA